MTPHVRSETVQALLAQREWVQRIARTLVRDPHRADDLAQKTLATALERPPADGRAPRAWLGTVLRNALRRDVRASARRVRREQAVAKHEASESTLDVLVRAEMHERVVRAVLELEEHYRRTLLLRYFDRLSPREVARRMQVPVETVRTRTRRALGALRITLDERSGGSRRGQALLTAIAGPGFVMNAVAGIATLGVLAMKAKLAIAAALLLVGLALFAVGRSHYGTDVAAPVRSAEDQTGRPALEGRAPGAPPLPTSEDASEAVGHPELGNGVLAGTALTERGQPVQGVDVALGDGRGVTEMAGRKAMTDEEGQFRFEELVAGSYALAVVNSFGHVLGPLVAVDLASGEQRDGVVVVVPDTSMVTGTLVDEGGWPLPGTQIELMPLDPLWMIGSYTTTDAAGRFRIVGLRDETHEARIGNYAVPTPIDAGARDVRVVYRASEMRRLAGMVLGPQGQPVPQASFGVLVGPEGRQRQYSTRVQAGRFEIEIPRSEARHDFSVHAVQDAAGEPLDVQPWRRNQVQLTADEIEIRLLTGRSLAGRVVDAKGDPLSGVPIRLLAQSSKDGTMTAWIGSPSVTSAKDGTFAFDRLYDGTLELMVLGVPGWAHPGRVVIAPDEVDATIQMHPSSDISGTLMDGEGRPVAHQKVTAWGSGLDPQRIVASSDAHGHFTLAGLLGPSTYRLGVSSLNDEETTRFATCFLFGVAPGTKDLMIVLKPSQAIEGEVITHDDKPQPWATASAEIQLVDGTWVEVAREHLQGKRHRFSLRGLPAGPVRLSARASRGPHLPTVPIEVTAPATDVVLRLRPGVVLQGQIRAEGLSPSALRGGGAVWISTGSGRHLWGRTAFLDDSGYFSIEGLPAERGALFVWTKAYDRCAWLPDVRSDAGPFAIELTPGLSIEGHVVGLIADAQEVTVWATRVGCEPSNVIWSVAPVAADGRFVIRALPPGSYLLGGTLGTSREVRAEAGDTGVKLDWNR